MTEQKQPAEETGKSAVAKAKDAVAGMGSPIASGALGWLRRKKKADPDDKDNKMSADAPAPETAAATTEAAGEPAAPAAPPSAPARTYRVQQGDTLWDIAARYYGGDGTKFTKIAEANGIANPDLIQIGMELTIPD